MRIKKAGYYDQDHIYQSNIVLNFSYMDWKKQLEGELIENRGYKKKAESGSSFCRFR